MKQSTLRSRGFGIVKCPGNITEIAHDKPFTIDGRPAKLVGHRYTHTIAGWYYGDIARDIKLVDDRATVEALAEKCEDAYSTDRYNGGWKGCVRMLRKRGYDDRQIEAILRSKWTRWAADSSDKPYGRATSTDLARFLDNTKWGRPLADEVAQLTTETFGSTAV